MTAANTVRTRVCVSGVGEAPPALSQMLRTHPAVGSGACEPLPAPAGEPPYRLRLAEVLPAREMRAIERVGRLRFHCVGDTGGIYNPIPQGTVAAAMTRERRGADPVRFFYHLGDIVYLLGEEANYESQFSAPYSDYDAPIFAIPGNHDGGRVPGTSGHSLEAFVRHFCAPTPTPTPALGAGNDRRPASRQPNVFWTLRQDWITIIGLYTNVPEGGHIADDQARWLTSELRAAPVGSTLILTMHHPVYSADSQHGSNLALGKHLDWCFDQAGRWPDAVFSAHAHSYQRFTRSHDSRKIPYVVAGTGGFHELHEIATGISNTPATFDGLPDVRLERYQHTRFGFMTVTAAPEGTEVVYNVVGGGEARAFDRFAVTPRAFVAQRDAGVGEPRRVRAAFRSLSHVPRTARANRIP